MKTIILNRDFGNKSQTLGVFYVIENDKILFKCECIERGWQDNKRMVSCIPTGVYPIKKEWSNRFKKDLWEIYEVEDRSECKIHSANYARQLNGCIALGSNRIDIDGDGNLDVSNSKNTIDKFHKVMGNDTEAIIVISNIIDDDGNK